MVILEIASGKDGQTNIDAPELLHRIKCDDFFEKIVPVVALMHINRRTKSML